MRTTPIINIIRRYGLTSKRLNPKNRIKYEDAIKMIKKYESSNLKIKDVLDNTRNNSHNGCRCGIPGCGQRIRYEYILVDKDDNNEELVVGSTCVWPTLGMSELKKKEFMKLDSVMRDYYALLDWREAHKVTVNKLEDLKKYNISFYKAFWQEIETAPLLDEDTEFINSVDVEKEIEKAEYDRKMKEIEKAEYQKALSYVPELREFYKNDSFVNNLCNLASYKSYKLTGNQYRWLKVTINRMWFAKNVKGTANDLTNDCDDILKSVFSMFDFKKHDLESVRSIDDYVHSIDDSTIKWAWIAYKCKNAVVR